METSSLTKRNICGSALKRLRTSKQYSQEHLAVQCQLVGWDVDRKLVSKMEIGLREIGDAELRVLAQILEVGVSDFFEMSPKELKGALNVLMKTRQD